MAEGHLLPFFFQVFNSSSSFHIHLRWHVFLESFTCSAERVYYSVPCTNSVPYTHFHFGTSHTVLYLPFLLDCELMDPCQRPTCFIPFCEDGACQEGGVINYELKFTFSFRFRINLKLIQQWFKSFWYLLSNFEESEKWPWQLACSVPNWT